MTNDDESSATKRQTNSDGSGEVVAAERDVCETKWGIRIKRQELHGVVGVMRIEPEPGESGGWGQWKGGEKGRRQRDSSNFKVGGGGRETMKVLEWKICFLVHP